MPPINPRTMLIVFLVSLILTFFTTGREKQHGGHGLTNGYISWNEFVQDLLSKGEVSNKHRKAFITIDFMIV
jgi:hypothetical protein